MTTQEIIALIQAGREHDFYVSSAWLKRRAEILRKDKYECQFCKAKGRYRKARVVHHVKHLKDRPDLALEEYYIDDNGKKQRQLVSSCRECHEVEGHPERMRKQHKARFWLPERWD